MLNIPLMDFAREDSNGKKQEENSSVLERFEIYWCVSL